MRLEPVLQQDPRRVVGADCGAADDEDLPVARKFLQARAELRQRDIERARNRLDGQFRRIAHIEQECAVDGESQWQIGMSPRRIFAATIPAKLTGSFALPKGGA